MSFEQQLAVTVANAKSFDQIDGVSRALWAAHGAGLIDDASAQALAEALEGRKRAAGSMAAPRSTSRMGGPPRRFVPRSPNRQASIERRRACAASGAVPSAIACNFTQGEVAVLSIVALEAKRVGSCSWPIDRIAACAGVSRRLAQYALRRAEVLGLVSIEERPRPGAKHLPSIVRVISAEWRAWLRLGRDRMQKSASHGNNLFKPGSTWPDGRRRGAETIGEKQRSGKAGHSGGDAGPSPPD